MGLLSQMFEDSSQISDNEVDIVSGIEKNDNRVISAAYVQNFDKVKKMVYLFRNARLDPEDIFQDGFTLAIMNIQQGKFRSESSFSTYLIAICRNLCLKQLTKLNKITYGESIEMVDEVQDLTLFQEMIKFKMQLGEKCKEVIDLRFALGVHYNKQSPNKCLSFDEIAYHLKITTVSARQRFKRCIDKLRELVMESSELKNNFSKVRI